MIDTECSEDSDICSLTEIIVDQLDISSSQISESTTLSSLEMDSIDTVELTLGIEEYYNVKISDNMLAVILSDKEMTIKKLVELVNDLKAIKNEQKNET